MRIEIPAREILPGDQVWFPNCRRPEYVTAVEDRQGAARLIVLTGESGVIWHQFYDEAVVFKYEPEPVVEVEVEPQFLDPEGNPT